jgi:tetratricopeptide (TPR) repeat protein
MKRELARDENFDAYTGELLRHHYLLSEGKEAIAEAEQAEERLSTLWVKLDDTQRQQLRGVSSDLNWIRRGFVPPPKGRKREDVTPEELREFYRLNENQDYFEMLPALRVCAAAVPPVFVAFVRATCYSHLDLRAVSEPFLRAVIEMGAKENMLSRAAFDMLVHVSPSTAFEQSSRIIASPEKYATISIAQAVTYVIGFLGGDPTAFNREYLANVLRQASKRLDEAPMEKEDRIRFLMTVGAQLSSFGHIDEGVGFLEQALKVDPDNAELIGWLGESLYTKDRKRAIQLLKRSIRAGTRLVRPYVYLANNYFAAKNFAQAKYYAAMVVEKARDNFTLGVGLEVMAICLYHEGAPPLVVLDMLRHAYNLAPSIKRIAANLQAFEEFMLRKSKVATWETEEQPVEFETRERWGSEEFEYSAS